MVVVVAQPGLVDLGLVAVLHPLGDAVDLGSRRDVGIVLDEGDLFEGPLGEPGLGLGDDEDAPAVGFRTGGSAQTVDVALLVKRDADLENSGDAGEIHASGNDVGGDEDGSASIAEVVGDLGTLALGDAAVQDGDGRETGHVGENVSVKVGQGSGRSEDDGLEGGVLRGLLADAADHGGRHRGEVGHLDEELGNALVGVDLADGDGGDELVAGREHKTGDLLDVGGHGGGEEHALAVGALLVGQMADNIAEGLHEAHVEQTVGLIEDERVQPAQRVDDVFVGHVVDKAARRGDEDVAAAQDLLLLAVLVGAADGDAHAVLRQALQQVSSLLGDLHGQLARGRDDEQRDARIRTAALGDHGLQGGQQEGDGLAGSGLGLDEAVAAVGRQQLRERGCLDGRHVVKLEVVGDGLDDGGMHQVGARQLGEPGRVHGDGLAQRGSGRLVQGLRQVGRSGRGEGSAVRASI